LGKAIGARVDPLAHDVDADLAIIVKRPRVETLQRLHQAAVPIVWDVVDAWPQPDGNDWDEAICQQWLERSWNSNRSRGAHPAMAEIARFTAGAVPAAPRGLGSR
jgi:hypothetical protein